MWTRFGNNCFQTNLRNKFVKKNDHKKLNNNRKLMLFAFDKKFYNFFKIKCQSAFELTFWLIFSHCLRKNWSRFFQSNCCVKLMPFGKFFIHYAIWELYHLRRNLLRLRKRANFFPKFGFFFDKMLVSSFS